MASIELVQVGSNDPKLAAAFEAKAKELVALPDNLKTMTIAAIARLVMRDWKKINFAAVPYLDAMRCLNTVDEKFGLDSGRSIVMYFLGNAQTWRGDVAKLVKAELNRRIK